MQLSDSHKKRIISGLIMAGALVGCLAAGGWPLRILITFTALLALWEFLQLFWKDYSFMVDKAVAYAVALFLCLVPPEKHGFLQPDMILAMAALFVALRFLFRYGTGDTEASLTRYSLMLFAIIYIPLNLQNALLLSWQEQFIVILGAIASDTGAYYAGSHLGKRKIWPSVSPKKSWEGSFGGMATSMLAVALFASIAGVPGMGHLKFWHFGFFGILLSIAAQMGDFFESAIKRAQGVKDSSNIIPGHGGVLDRIDSLLFVLPTFMLIRHLCTRI